MKKRIGIAVAIVMIALIVFLPVWRFWPHTASSLIPYNEVAVTSASASMMVIHFDGGESDIYGLRIQDAQDSNLQSILEILATSDYRQDLRNLLPWGIDGVSADKNYDGRGITVNFYFKDAENKVVELQFLSPSIVAVRTEQDAGIRIYHPTSNETFEKLAEFLEAHGVKSL